MDDMKVSFKVEITGCEVEDVRCPHLNRNNIACNIILHGVERIRAVLNNKPKLTETCPMVRAQFEALI